MPETVPRTVAELREAAWRAFATAGKPLTPKALALKAGITDGGAHRFLTDWRAEGRAVPLSLTPPPGPHETPWTLAGADAAHEPRVPQAFRVLVTGSRTWIHEATLTAALDRLHAEHGGRLVVVHGACGKGADAIADRWARTHGVQVETHPADWSAGRSAGPHRNAAMVATRPDACLAFIRDDSPGATGCVRLAEDAGIPTTRHTHPAPATTPRRSPRPAPDVVLAAALAYAARGRAVFMLGRTKRPVANCPLCRDANDGHDPQACECLTCHGFYAASTDPDRVRAIVAAVPGGLLAVRTGAISDLVVMDIDPRNGGRLLPDLMPPTEAVATGGGGWHLLYRHPGGYVASRRLPGHEGIDVKADGGVIVVPPSVHPDSGVAYRPVPGRDHPTEMHPRLRDLVLADVAASPGPPPIGDRPARPTTLKRAGCISDPAALLEANLRTVRDAPEGSRRRTLYGAARGVARMVAAGALDPREAVSVLTAAGLAAEQTPRQVHNAITAAFTAEGVPLPTQEAA